MSRLSPGYRFYRLRAEEWRYVTPELRFHRVQGPEKALALVARAVAGDVPAMFDAGSPEAVLWGLLVEAGVVRGPDSPRPVPPPWANRVVTVAGDGPVADAITFAVGGERVGELDVASMVAAPGVVVACSALQRDRVWQEVGALRADAGLPWQCVFVEGRAIVVSPLACQGGLSYRDYRARRLAAADAADELTAFWNQCDDDLTYLDSSRGWPGRGVCSIAAGIVLHDLELCRNGTTPPGAATECTIDSIEGTVARHPVFAIPEAVVV